MGTAPRLGGRPFYPPGSQNGRGFPQNLARGRGRNLFRSDWGLIFSSPYFILRQKEFDCPKEYGISRKGGLPVLALSAFFA
jgi:hypothetical protein